MCAQEFSSIALHRIPLRQGLSLNLELTFSLSFFLARLSEQWAAAILLPHPHPTLWLPVPVVMYIFYACARECVLILMPSSQSSCHCRLLKRVLDSYNSITLFLWFCILLTEIWFLTWFSLIFISKYHNRMGRLQSHILCTYLQLTSVLACRIYSIDSGLLRLLQSVFCRVPGVLWHRRGNTKQATFNILREDLT